jgi:transcriptional regulator with XRE-family HTH domain
MSAHRRWRAGGLARHRPSQGQHLASCARSEGDAVRHRPRLQRTQRARLLSVGFRLGEVRLAIVLEQHAPAREPLHQPGDDGLQQLVQSLFGGCGITRQMLSMVEHAKAKPSTDLLAKLAAALGCDMDDLHA